MALQASGLIKLSEVAAEFGGSAPHRLSEYYSADTGVPASGVISLSDFYSTQATNAVTSMNLTDWSNNISSISGATAGSTESFPSGVWIAQDEPFGLGGADAVTARKNTGATGSGSTQAYEQFRAISSGLGLYTNNWQYNGTGYGYIYYTIPVQKLQTGTYAYNFDINTAGMSGGSPYFNQCIVRLRAYSNFNSGSPSGLVTDVQLADTGSTASNTSTSVSGQTSVSGEYVFVCVLLKTDAYSFSSGVLGMTDFNMYKV